MKQINPLTFDALSRGNKLRDERHYKEWPNWTATDWACALAGEVGEACNKVKKLRRLKGVYNVALARSLYHEEIATELADAVIYADILAQHLGFNLGEVIRQKFNEVSDREGCDVKL